jgi:6-phosphogluconate dehydrogenase
MKQAMQLGMIGLGRMGANMVRRLLKNGQKCIVFDRSPNAVGDLVKEGAGSLADLVAKLEKQKTKAA